MVKQKWKVYTFWIVLCELVGVASGFLSREGIAIYNASAAKPPFAPPSWVFPIVWTILFALMGISAARVSLSVPSKLRYWGLNVFIAQLTVNFFWPLFFFNLQLFGFSLIWLIILWLLVVLTISLFRKIDGAAAWLLTPYLAWLTFAAVLNGAAWIING